MHVAAGRPNQSKQYHRLQSTEEWLFGYQLQIATSCVRQVSKHTEWHHYYPNTDGVVFIVDSADKRRFQLAQRELHALMCNPLLSSIPFLIFANKQDIEGAATTAEVTNALDMYRIKNRPWKVAESVGTSGVGIDEGFNWLSKTI